MQAMILFEEHKFAPHDEKCSDNQPEVRGAA